MRLSTVILPSQRWAQAKSRWVRAENLGFYAAYTYDHLSWRSFREEPWFTMIPTLTAAALVTEAIRLGPLVTSPNFRHPLLLAKDLLALDDVSHGRVIVGVGSGGTGFDATTLGHAAWSASERHERFVEFTLALDVLLREPASSIDATFYPVVESRQIPGPLQLPRPPLLVSAMGPKSLALTAQVADGWVSIGDPMGREGASTISAVTRQVAMLDEALSAAGRDPSTIERVLLNYEGDERPLASLEAFLDWAGRYRALGFDELVVHWPVPDSMFEADVAVFERIAVEGADTILDWD